MLFAKIYALARKKHYSNHSQSIGKLQFSKCNINCMYWVRQNNTKNERKKFMWDDNRTPQTIWKQSLLKQLKWRSFHWFFKYFKTLIALSFKNFKENYDWILDIFLNFRIQSFLLSVDDWGRLLTQRYKMYKKQTYSGENIFIPLNPTRKRWNK